MVMLFQVTSENVVCQACWDLAQDVVLGRRAIDAPTQVGHSSVCLRCGRSLLARRFNHLLRNDSARESAIYNVIREWILPQTVDEASRICHSCWILADRAAVHMSTGPSTSSQSNPPPAQSSVGVSVGQLDENHDNILHEPENVSIQPEQNQGNDDVHEPSVELHSPSAPIVEPVQQHPEPTIVLPDYMRAVETERRCFIEGCQRTERYRVPLATRKMLLNEHKYYVPQNNRLCDIHLVIEAWDFLDSLRSNYLQTFTARHIQDMFTLKETPKERFLNFENIDNMDDHVVHTWIGFTKVQFRQLFDEVPQLIEIRNSSSVLAAYLIKLRSGDSNERLATLFKTSKKTLAKWLCQARDILTEHFVPRHLGLEHITREQIKERNLAIPSALFEGDSRPIAIFDGTYCYIEKSSNYLYQKKTYSLHKYRNLTKPFLMVCTDGYIIDVLGPYPATTSDSDIMRHEFLSGNPLQDFFQNGDVFILDRGFRDSLPLLNQCGYRTYVPATLAQGETQLSTLDANKSRAVTICRWVVEIVNGRFKRDFKLFRQCYFNTASRSLIRDFKVAAALINRFHPPITDRIDCGAIINQINLNMNRHNILGDFIVNNQYNRRRADFETITIHNDNLNDFPQLSYDELILVCLGTYQLKQARSYFGEHLRGNDGFIIEVCREVSSSLLRQLSASNTSWLLRGRIQSRHISRKTYFVYILVDSCRRGRDSILSYYCNCIVGRRTVGCCAHVMCIIWYLSWARFQENIVPPAQFLDDILIIIEDE
nr:uncharacterized protein LOC126055576 isoform X3 [Helicoverpa armigera]